MAIKKTLAKILLLGGLTFGGIECTMNYGELEFNGTIEDEKIVLKSDGNYNSRLERTKKDGTIIIYEDLNSFGFSRLKPYSIDCITSLDSTRKINNTWAYDRMGRRTMREGKKQFNDYIQTITKIKQTEGLKLLKK